MKTLNTLFLVFRFFSWLATFICLGVLWILFLLPANALGPEIILNKPMLLAIISLATFWIGWSFLFIMRS